MRQRAHQLAVAVASLLCVSGATAWAHHSYAAFDMSKRLLVKGTVQAFEWTNPHCWIRVLVPNPDGSAVVWNVEAGTPNVDARRGWSPTDLRPGDKVELIVYPLHDGSPGGTLASVTLPDGRVLRAR
jgi:hypothetical protein